MAKISRTDLKIRIKFNNEIHKIINNIEMIIYMLILAIDNFGTTQNSSFTNKNINFFKEENNATSNRIDQTL